MKRKDFDDIIKSKLQQLDGDIPTSDWNVFEQMLEEDQLSDQLFDDKISSELKDIRSPYRHDHWERMHELLELQQERNNAIVGYKIVELSMLFLFFLTLFNFAGIDNDGHKQYTQAHDTHEVQATTVVDDVNKSSHEIMGLNGETRSIQLSTKRNTRSSSDTKTQPSREKASAPLIAQVLIDEAVDDYQPLQTDVPKKSDIEQAHTSSNEYVDNYEINEIPSINHELDAKTQLPQAPKQTLVLDLSSDNQNNHYITAFGAMDNNLVNSPFDQVYNKSGYETYGLGYSMGAQYSYRENRAELFAGLAYSNRSYEPRFIAETYGNTRTNFYQTGLKHINFHIISAVAGIQYLALKGEKWNVGLTVGSSANIIAWSDYLIEDTPLDGLRPSAPRANRSPILLDDKPFYNGVLQGGAIKDNFYLTFDFGLSYEQWLTENNALYLSPGYSIHSISDGIGPNNDKIHNLSLKLGVKHRL